MTLPLQAEGFLHACGYAKQFLTPAGVTAFRTRLIDASVSFYNGLARF
jgi:hypothetical protein